MEFAFTEDQLAITEAARGMLLETCTPADLRKRSEAGQDFDPARWKTIVEMGLLGMLVPEAKGGLGLGLWIVKELVAAMEGSVSVESKPEQGARFLVELPLAGPEAGAPPA